MKRIKHSKVKNTGLIFELLVRQVASDTMNNKDSKALRVLKKHYNAKSELTKELKLYRTIAEEKFTNESKAEKFVDAVLRARKQINESQLRRDKYNLIKDLKKNYLLEEFFKSRVKNYKLHASTYKLFEFINSLSPDEKTESFFNLVEHITTDKNEIKLSETITNLPDDEDLRILTYKTLLEKFNQKYTKLSGAQKNLLKEYINNISNTNSLKDTLRLIVSELKKDLKTHSKNLKDKVVKIKLKEAINSIDKFCGVDSKKSIVKDSHVLQTMRYLELVKEMKKSGNKNKKLI